MSNGKFWLGFWLIVGTVWIAFTYILTDADMKKEKLTKEMLIEGFIQEEYEGRLGRVELKWVKGK